MAIEFKRRAFTVDEYHKLFETNVLGENDRVELIDGELIEMPPIGMSQVSRHARIVKYLTYALDGRACVLPMGSYPLGSHSEPQPDVALFPYDPDYYARRPYPPVTEYLAFVEIAVTSLAYDANVKMRLYARFGVMNYLLVDVRHDELIVFSEPRADGYGTVKRLHFGEHFSLSGVPDVELATDAFVDVRDGMRCPS